MTPDDVSKSPGDDMAARLARIERVLGMQTLRADEGVDDADAGLAGGAHSHASTGCSNNSGLSIGCHGGLDQVEAATR
jgi:hypothetical protein